MTEQRPAREQPSQYLVIARAGETARANGETVRSLLPSERQHLAQLLREGRVASAYLEVDGSTVFLLIPGSDDEFVRATLREFPLYAYLEWELHEVRGVSATDPAARRDAS
jgi:hypothetical protein